MQSRVPTCYRNPLDSSRNTWLHAGARRQNCSECPVMKCQGHQICKLYSAALTAVHGGPVLVSGCTNLISFALENMLCRQGIIIGLDGLLRAKCKNNTERTKRRLNPASSKPDHHIISSLQTLWAQSSGANSETSRDHKLHLRSA